MTENENHITFTRNQAKSLLVGIELALPGMLHHPSYKGLASWEKDVMRNHQRTLKAIENKLNIFLKQ